MGFYNIQQSFIHQKTNPMQKEPVENFMDFIQLLEKERKGEFKFSSLDQIVFSLSMLGKIEEKDSVVPTGTGEFVALISHNVIPDELEFVDKKGNFVVITMELAHLLRVFPTRGPLITWIIPNKL